MSWCMICHDIFLHDMWHEKSYVVASLMNDDHMIIMWAMTHDWTHTSHKECDYGKQNKLPFIIILDITHCIMWSVLISTHGQLLHTCTLYDQDIHGLHNVISVNIHTQRQLLHSCTLYDQDIHGMIYLHILKGCLKRNWNYYQYMSSVKLNIAND